MTALRTIAAIDEELGRLRGVVAEKQAALDADYAKHRSLWDEPLQRRLEQEIPPFRAKITKLDELRHQYLLNGEPPPPPPPPAPKPKAPSAPAYVKSLSPDPDDDEASDAFTAAWQSAVLKTQKLMAGIYSDGITHQASSALIEFALVDLAMLHHLAMSRIKALEARLSDFEGKGLEFMGVYNRSIGYRRGQVVTFGGCTWIAIAAVEPIEQPGISKKWQLAVKAGKDGKDAGSPARKAQNEPGSTSPEC